MITTVIPYLLLAQLPDNTLRYGPEYIYSLDINVNSEGTNNVVLYPGLNVTNELKCRPKTDDVLSCQFRHLQFDFFNRNLATGEVTRKNPNDDANHHHGHHEVHHVMHQHGHHHRRQAEEPPSYVFNTLPFEVKFDKSGVESIIMAETTSKDKLAVNLVKSVANLLNTGTDLTNKMPTKSDVPTKSEEIINFLIGKCMGEVQVTYDSNNEHLNSNDIPNDSTKNFMLDMAHPLKKISTLKLLLRKSMNPTNCPSPLKFFWSGLIAERLEQDPNLKMVTLNDDMTITKDDFASKFSLSMETIKDGHQFFLSEAMNLYLTEIKPANEEMLQIKDPTKISIDSNV